MSWRLSTGVDGRLVLNHTENGTEQTGGAGGRF